LVVLGSRFDRHRLAQSQCVMAMFALYHDERNIFSFDDYGALLAECRRINARTILEFGPGISTLALIESGAERIATCEYQDQWIAAAQERLKGHRQVSLHRYRNDAEVSVNGLCRARFDLAFVDSPVGQPSPRSVTHPGQEECNRLNTVLYAISRAPVVLLHDAKREGEGYTLARVAAAGHAVTMIATRKGIARIERCATSN
jgi:hypothetical protein